MAANAVSAFCHGLEPQCFNKNSRSVQIPQKIKHICIDIQFDSEGEKHENGRRNQEQCGCDSGI